MDGEVDGGPISADAIWRALGGLKDPCMVAAGLDLSLVDLGLIDHVNQTGGLVEVGITLTDVGCQFTHRVLGEIYEALETLPGVSEVRVTPNWKTAWAEDRLSQSGRAAFMAAKARLRRSAPGGPPGIAAA